MIVLIIVVLLLLSACRDWSDAEDWERSEYNAELRHQELLEEYRRTDKLKITKATRKRTARDKHGNILSEEITIEERDSDEIDLDEYDFDDEE
jgi:hypothetical protein